LRQQRRQNRLAGTGIRAGDEKNAFHFVTSKRKCPRRAIKTFLLVLYY
jgi:hypothetical protein